MNKFLLILAFSWLSFSWATAQNTAYKNSIRVGVDYVILSTPDDVGLRYLARYARHLADDRIVLEGSVGYLSASGPKSIFPSGGKHRQRITGEFTALYDFVKSPIHALRLGIGPSIWNRQDDVRGVDVAFYPVNQTSIGAHAVVEYEYRVSTRLALSGRYGVAYFDVPGPSSMLGLNVGYRF